MTSLVISYSFPRFQDVNDRHQWLSSIRKTCVSNPDMLRTFHPGAFRSGKWTCCLGTNKAGKYMMQDGEVLYTPQKYSPSICDSTFQRVLVVGRLDFELQEYKVRISQN